MMSTWITRACLCVTLLFITSCSGQSAAPGPRETFTFVQLSDPQLGFYNYEQDKAALAQAVQHPQRVGADVLARDRMLVPRNDPQGHGVGAGGFGGFGEGLGRHRQPMDGWGYRFAASVSLLY